MNITWKQQHINSSCVPACVAMLLSQHQISKEDFEIIHESKRPYLIEFDQSQKAFRAGAWLQTPEIMNIVPNKYDLEIVHYQFECFDDYYAKSSQLIKNQTAFLTSLPQNLLPSGDYSAKKNVQGHAVVVFKIDEKGFHFLDPDGGINRAKSNRFCDVSDWVCYSISQDEIQHIQHKWILGHLQKRKKNPSDVLDLLEKSKPIFEKLSSIAHEQARLLFLDQNRMQYDAFYGFILRIIKPLALDLKNALLTIPKPTKHEQNLISKLEELFAKTLKVQKIVKENPALKIQSHMEPLLSLFDEIALMAVTVVKNAIQTYGQIQS